MKKGTTTRRDRQRYKPYYDTLSNSTPRHTYRRTEHTNPHINKEASVYLLTNLTPAPSENGSFVSRYHRIQVPHVNVDGSITMGEVTDVFHHWHVTIMVRTYV